MKQRMYSRISLGRISILTYESLSLPIVSSAVAGKHGLVSLGLAPRSITSKKRFYLLLILEKKTVDFILVFIDILDIRQTENIPGTVLLFFATQSLFQRRGKYQSSYVFWDLPKLKLEICKSMTFVVITR